MMVYADTLLALLSLLFLILAVGLAFLLIKPQFKRGFVFSGSHQLKASSVVFILKWTYRLLAFVALGALFMALARPQKKTLEQRQTEKGIDILFVLDISDSMLIEDMHPHENRLESAKFHIKEFIANRSSDRMGLVVFSGEAYTRIPLTIDHGLLLTDLKSLSVSENLKKGTAIGVALASAVNRVRESVSKSKIIVFLTDGENNTGVIDPLTALDLAVEGGTKVYTIGMGRDGPSQLPVFTKDRFGRKVKTYRPFPTQINEELLQDIASKTGAQFYRAAAESDMSRVFKDIDQLERSDIKLPKVYKTVEHFQVWLLISVLLFLFLSLAEVLVFWKGW